MNRPHVVIVGGGIAGLSSAWTLCQQASPPCITVLESSSRWGGKIQTTDFDGMLVDNGPDAFLATVPSAKALCDELGISTSLVAPDASNAWIWSRGKLQPFPLGTVLGVPSNIFSLANIISLRGMARTTLDLVLPKQVGRDGQDPSIGHLIRRRLGNEVADRLIDPLIGGINAGSIDNLSMRFAAPQVAALADSHRSLFWAAQQKVPKHAKNVKKQSPFLAPTGGMQVLVDTLVQRLQEHGVEMRTEQSVSSVAQHERGWTMVVNDKSLQADALILATPSPGAAQIIRKLDARAAVLLSSVRYASVAMVRMTYNAGDIGHSLDGSGFVVPAADKTLMTACSWASSKWNRLAQPGKVILRVSAGRFSDTRAEELDDGVLAKALHEELCLALRINGEPRTFDVTRWTKSFPQYECGHAGRMRQARAFLDAFRTLSLAGSSYDGVGIPACIESGKVAATRTLTALYE